VSIENAAIRIRTIMRDSVSAFRSDDRQHIADLRAWGKLYEAGGRWSEGQAHADVESIKRILKEEGLSI
jgi:hypothetical protein